MAKIQGHLTLVGDDFDTALVSKMLGRLPTYVREKTEVLGNGQLFGHCEWGVETALIEAEDFQPVSDSLREMLDCSAELLKKLLTIATQNGVFCTMWRFMMTSRLYISVRILSSFPQKLVLILALTSICEMNLI